MEHTDEISVFRKVAIEVTNMCNLRCPACWLGNRPKTRGMMDLNTFDEILKILKRDMDARGLVLEWRGEPTLSPFLPDMVKSAKENGFWTATSTNTATANLHSRYYVRKLLEHLDKLAVCVDGYNQETLEKYRVGAKWETVIENLETISKFKGKCRLEMRVLMFRYNEGHESFFRQLAWKYKMNRLIFRVPCILGKNWLTQEEGEEWLARDPKYRKHFIWDGEIWKPALARNCFASTCNHIAVNGNIPICCIDWNIKHKVGNIFTDSIETIRENCRSLTPKARLRELDICKNCYIPPYMLHQANFKERPQSPLFWANLPEELKRVGHVR